MAGRPRKEIDQTQFEKLCALQCTKGEIAAWFKCSEDTIENWCNRELKMNFSAAFKTYSAEGKISLRRNLYRMSERNAGVAIFLAKNYLGMRDNMDVALESIDPKVTVEVEKMVQDAKKRSS